MAVWIPYFRRVNVRRILLFLAFGLTVLYIDSVSRISKAAQTDLWQFKLNPYLGTYIQENASSCLICPTQLLKECQDYSQEKSSRLLVYFIPSAPRNFENRQAIRATWASFTHPRPVFITGYPKDPAVMVRLLEEAYEHSDIIVEDLLDSYRNLTIKTALILKNFLALCPQADFLIKVDDDVLIQPQVVQEILLAANDDQLTGRVLGGLSPQRIPWSKYYLPKWLYKGSSLPTICQGTAYALPGRRIRDIYETAFSVPIINLEDVFFTGLVAGKALNLSLVHDDRFWNWSQGGLFYGNDVCPYKWVALSIVFPNYSQGPYVSVAPGQKYFSEKLWIGCSLKVQTDIYLWIWWNENLKNIKEVFVSKIQCNNHSNSYHKQTQ